MAGCPWGEQRKSNCAGNKQLTKANRAFKPKTKHQLLQQASGILSSYKCLQSTRVRTYMTPLTLFHIPRFRSTRALWMYLELASLYKSSASPLPHLTVKEFVDIEKFRNDKPEWYLKLNPNGKVPVLIDELTGVKMWESCAVCFYLLEQYDVNNLLLPKGATGRALFQQLSFFASGTMDNLNSTSSPVQRGVLLMNKGSKAQMNPDFTSPRYLTQKAAWNEYIGPYFEGLLAESSGEYLLGDSFSAVDLILATGLYGIHDKCITRGDGISWIDENRFPRISNYFREIKQRDCWKMAYADTKDWKNFDASNLVVPLVVPTEQ